jgi:ABC-2 type transport system ATP-binding protein
MRMVTGFIPPSAGSITVGGFDMVENPIAGKRLLGYLPENVPMYMEMRVEEYLDFRGRLRKMPRTERRQRIDYVIEHCWLQNVRRRVIGHLSKGYRQRVGLADSLLHNPAVLILDEPTVGLDPTQIRESRKLIKSLGGNHTVILSTHILPEVEQTCEQVVIITKGKIVATDSVRNLRSRARGGESVVIGVAGHNGALEAESVQQKLAQVAGVSTVALKDSEDGHYTFEIEAEKDFVRGDLARAVIASGWDLNELRPTALSLEEIFLQLTGDDAQVKTDGSVSAREIAATREVGS